MFNLKYWFDRIKKQQQLDKKKKISSSGCGLDLKEYVNDLFLFLNSIEPFFMMSVYHSGIL